MAEARNRAEVARRVSDLGRQGCLTGRDELLLRLAAEVGGLTLGQAHRLGWPAASTVVAYQRLNRLRGWGLLASTPLPPEVAAWGLGPGPVYQLGPAGQLWLKPRATLDWRGRPGHWAEPLLAAELLVRLATQERAVNWRGPVAAQSQFELKLAVSGAALWRQGQALFHLAGLAHRSVDWGAVVRGFDLSARGRTSPLPPLALLLPDAAQAAQVGTLIEQQLRKGTITLLVADWPAVAAVERLTTAPIWRQIRTGAEPQAGQTLAGAASG